MSSEIRAYAIVPCRAGSVGLVNKNRREICGVPIWLHAVHAAQRAGMDRVIVSTDDRVILEKPACGWTCSVRPPSLATSEASVWSVLQHVALEAEHADLVPSAPDVWVCMNPTSPLRTTGTVRAAVQAAHDAQCVAMSAVYDTGWAYYGDDGPIAYGELGVPANRQCVNKLPRFHGAVLAIPHALLREPNIRPYIPIVTGRVEAVDIDDEVDMVSAAALYEYYRKDSNTLETG